MERVIIDCDPSADDGIALLLSLASRELAVEGVTAAAGVAGVGQSKLNGRRILRRGNREDVPTARGAAHPLCLPISSSLLYGGKDGMSDTGIPWPRVRPVSCKAEEFIMGILEKSREPVSIISIAPMTNLARLLEKYPEAAGRIRRIYTASGCYGVREGDTAWKQRPSWNIWTDPEAAQAVFASGIPIQAAGVDVTGTFSEAMADRILAEGNRDNPAFQFFFRAAEYNRNHKLSVFSLLVDAAAVALAVHPEWFSMHQGSVKVETEGVRRGHTVFCAVPEDEGRLSAAGWADREQFTNFIIERIFS